MPLYKLSDYPSYKEKFFDGDDIKGIQIYTANTREKIGTIDDVLVNEQGRFRYFVIDTGFWIFGKKVLLPVDYCRVDSRKQRILTTAIIDKKQIEELPDYDDAIRANSSYEQHDEYTYRNSRIASLNNVASLEASAPLDDYTYIEPSIPRDRNRVTNHSFSSTYQTEPLIYDDQNQEYQTLKLYEERLFADKKKRQAGEVVVAKHIETEKAKISLPLEKERIVIERTIPVNPQKIDLPQDRAFWEGEVTRLKVYEEVADVRKEAFIREEIRIVKEVEKALVEVEETLRREELDIDTNNRSLVDNKFINQ